MFEGVSVLIGGKLLGTFFGSLYLQVLRGAADSWKTPWNVLRKSLLIGTAGGGSSGLRGTPFYPLPEHEDSSRPYSTSDILYAISTDVTLS